MIDSIFVLQADDGMTSLHYAAKAGHVGIIKVLLDVDGINIDVKVSYVQVFFCNKLHTYRGVNKAGVDVNLE